MAYNNFTLESVTEQFELRLIDDSFCASFPNAEPKPEFLLIFDRWFPLAQAARTEKAKSELLVSPILIEAKDLVQQQVQLFSGEEFNVDQQRGLNGFCDFLISQSDNPFTIDAPVLMLVEAKRGEIENGLGQCVAEMIAAQTYNRNKNRNISTVYGSVTSGTLWQFLKLEGLEVTIDRNTYFVSPVQKILGILKSILSQ
jgi:hypothetical protein